jgi:hypothetical protein
LTFSQFLSSELRRTATKKAKNPNITKWKPLTAEPLTRAIVDFSFYDNESFTEPSNGFASFAANG